MTLFWKQRSATKIAGNLFYLGKCSFWQCIYLRHQQK